MFCPVHSCVYSPEWGQSFQVFSRSQLPLQTSTLPCYSVHSPLSTYTFHLTRLLPAASSVITSVKNDKNMVHLYNFREVETEGPGRNQCWHQCSRELETSLGYIRFCLKKQNYNTHYYSSNKKEPWSLFTWLSLHPLPPLAFSSLPSMLSFLEAISIFDVSNYILHLLLNILVWHFHYPAKKVFLSRSKNGP